MAEPERGRDLHDSVARYRRRREQWQREGEGSLARSLGAIGSLGWMVVTPTLLGILAGRWVDRRLATGITFTAALLALGLALGCHLAWRRMHHP